jgi:uncharacterized protein YdiU (UPF0061 family)
LSRFVFKNRYRLLGESFYELRDPAPVSSPGLIKFNYELAAELGIPGQELDEAYIAELFSGNKVHQSSEPLAMVYAGHQFGQFNPRLGDGRAIYLGELEHSQGMALDIQLKGSGRTRYSRGGDGRAALGPVLREYLVSEAMYRLNVPTTRALAAVTTGEQVMRDYPLPGGIITRAATSFIRVGSFQYFAMQDDLPAIRKLGDYVIERNYPQVKDAANPYLAFLESVVTRQAQLIAQWMQIGFIHGVMNTDNMSVAGETIDYGPCAFMDFYNHQQVYSSIDRQGRYAFNNQPSIGLWNLTRLAETLLPLFSEESEQAVSMAQEVLEGFRTQFESAWLSGMKQKSGLFIDDHDNDKQDKKLIELLLKIMAENQADFTLTFYYLSLLNHKNDSNDNQLRDLFINRDAISEWLLLWRQRLNSETLSDHERQVRMQSVNPVYIPRNHQIEAVIRAAEDNNDFGPFHQLYDVLQKPFEYQQGKDAYLEPPAPDEIVQQTFCGT